MCDRSLGRLYQRESSRVLSRAPAASLAYARAFSTFLAIYIPPNSWPRTFYHGVNRCIIILFNYEQLEAKEVKFAREPLEQLLSK